MWPFSGSCRPVRDTALQDVKPTPRRGSRLARSLVTMGVADSLRQFLSGFVKTFLMLGHVNTDEIINSCSL